GPLTSGSTSPFFTFLEAIVFVVFSPDRWANVEYIMPYVLGGVGLAGTVWFAFQLLRNVVKTPVIISIAGATLIAIETHLVTIGASGMETTLVTILLLWASYAFLRKDFTSTAVLCGLLVWSRPDTLLFIGLV